MKTSHREIVRMCSVVGAILLATIAFGLLMWASGKNPFETLWAVLHGAFGTTFGLKQSLITATPLLLCGLAAALPAKAGLFNIGGEGQLYFGATTATGVVLAAPWLPHRMAIPVLIAVSMLGGAVWGLWPGLLRAYLKVNEILVSLMLNFIAILLMQYLVHGPWKDPSALGWPYSIEFPSWDVLPRLPGSNIHLGLLLGLVFAVLTYFVLRMTTWGFSTRIIEASPATARYAGVRINAYVIALMMLGGAMAGLAGLGEVSVIQGRLRPGLSPGYGYTGFLVAWLADNHILWLIPVSIFVGGLYAGADAVQLRAGLPSTMADIFMGLVFAGFLVRTSLRERLKRQLVRVEVE